MWSNTYMPYARVPSDPSPVSRKSYVGETTSVTSVTPVKHSDNFKIVILLDESGSMEDVAENMLSSLNGLIKEQKQVKSRPCNLTLLKFHNSVKTVIDNCDLREIQLLKKSDYSPGGTTALYDALGYAMERFRYERDVLLVVLTDGQENASRQYNGKLPQLLKQIKERETHCGWSYVYLGCDLNTLSQGTSLGFWIRCRTLTDNTIEYYYVVLRSAQISAKPITNIRSPTYHFSRTKFTINIWFNTLQLFIRSKSLVIN